MLELFRLFKLDCASGRSSACVFAVTLKKFGTQKGDSFEVSNTHTYSSRDNVCCVLFLGCQ
jgi:hypothetical protein